MGVVIIFVGKQVETTQLIPKELVAAEAGYIQEIAGFQYDAVRGSADCHKVAGLAFVYREVTSLEIHQVFGKTEDTATELGTAGQSIKGDLAPIAAVKFLVGIDQQLQSGGFVFAVAVCIK